MKLAKKVKRVVAVELDDKLADYLQAGIDAQGVSKVEIVNEDILKFNLGAHLAAGEKYKIVANLPYNITSVVLRQFLSGARKPELMVLMLQKEVAARLVATPGDMSLLALSAQYYAETEIVREVKAGNFWPTPAVDSAVVRLKIRPEDFSVAADKDFFRLAKFGFSAKRKMLKNNLAGGLKIAPETTVAALAQAGLGAQVRAEDLSVADWKKLVAALKPFMV
jgi:16S rRNA (adenine1518-N6/adenine1519-N6)-dimethyltransferase